jgi:hypothetical protein
MDKLDRLELQVRVLRSRLDRLEARRAQHKREAAPRPDDAIISARESLWAKYVMLEMRYGHGRVKLTKLSFSTLFRLNPSEFTRWFSAADKKAIGEGTGQDQRFRGALAAAIAELETRARGGVPTPKLHDETLIAARVH